MKAHIQKISGHLGELGALAAKTDAAEKKILKRAVARLSEVNDAIEKKSGSAEFAKSEAQDEYLDLVAERGKLTTIIAKSRAILEKSAS